MSFAWLIVFVASWPTAVLFACMFSGANDSLHQRLVNVPPDRIFRSGTVAVLTVADWKYG